MDIEDSDRHRKYILMNAKEASRYGEKFYSAVSGLSEVFEEFLDNGSPPLNSRAMNLQLTTNSYRNTKPGEAVLP